MNLNYNTNTSFKGIPYEPSLQALNNLRRDGAGKFVENLIKYYKPLKESEVVDFFIKEENGKITEAYTVLKKPVRCNTYDTLEAGTKIKSYPKVGNYKNGTATIPVNASSGDPNLELVLGCGGLPERVAEDAIGEVGGSTFALNPALAYTIHLHDKLKTLFAL